MVFPLQTNSFSAEMFHCVEIIIYMRAKCTLHETAVMVRLPGNVLCRLGGFTSWTDTFV